MLEELHLFGVYMPAALAWAVVAGVIAHLLRNLLQRFPWSRHLGHPGVLEIAFFALLWWGLTMGADALFHHG